MKKTYSELPEELYVRLSGRNIEQHAHKVVLIHTIDSNGWAHPAILSYYEVAAMDGRNIRVAPYKTSTTTANLRATGKVTLSVFDERVACYIKGTATEIDAEMRTAPHNSKLNVAIEEVQVDYADPVLEPGAHITGGITWANPNKPGLEILQELLD